MATENQIRANRANAQHSTGPLSPEGKARVAANRRTHGLAVSRHVILPGESQADYDALLAEFTRDLAPASTIEDVFVHQAAEAHWKLRRLARYEAELLARYPNPFLIEDEKVYRKFTTLARYEAAARRAFHRAIEELRRLRAPQVRQLVDALNAALGENEPDHSNPIAVQPPASQPPAAPPSPPSPAADASSDEVQP